MAYQARPNSGAFRRTTTKRNPNEPDFWGDFVLGPDLIQYLVQAHRAGLEPKLKIKGWNKQNQKGNWISLAIEVPPDVSQQRGQQRPNTFGQQQHFDGFAPQPQQQRAYSNAQADSAAALGAGSAQNGYLNQGGVQRGYQPQQQAFEDPFQDEIPWK